MMDYFRGFFCITQIYSCIRTSIYIETEIVCAFSSVYLSTKCMFYNPQCFARLQGNLLHSVVTLAQEMHNSHKCSTAWLLGKL